MRDDWGRRMADEVLRADEVLGRLEASRARSHELLTVAEDGIARGREACARMDATIARLRGGLSAG